MKEYKCTGHTNTHTYIMYIQTYTHIQNAWNSTQMKLPTHKFIRRNKKYGTNSGVRKQP